MATSVSTTPAAAAVGGCSSGEMTTTTVSSSHHRSSRKSVTAAAASASPSATDAAAGLASPGSVIQVPLVRDTMTFDGRQASRLRDMERRAETEIKRKKRELEREIEKMREEFLRLYPSDRGSWSSAETQHYDQDALIAHRCGSTDVLDDKKMKTLFIVDGPGSRGFASNSSHHPDITTGRYYRIRFDTTGCDPTSVRVSTDGDRIVVRANKAEPVDDNDDNDDSNNATRYREYCRKIQKPKDVDHTKFKSYLTSDSVLIVEAPLQPVNPNIRKTAHSPSHSSRSISPSGSPAAGGPDTPSKDKIGVPVFREENGQRRLHLVVDVGPTFKPEDIIVQVIKDNKIQVRAKHEEKTVERLSKSKFSKEYELGERIETYSLTGGLAGDGRLIVGAFVRGHGEGSFTKPGGSGNSSSSTAAATGAVNGEGTDGDESHVEPAANDEATNVDSATPTRRTSVVDDETGRRKSVVVESCQVRSATSGGR